MLVSDKFLTDVRDLLLPGLWTDELDLQVNFIEPRGLCLVGYKNGKSGRRFISEAEIADKSYKRKFRPLVDSLKKEIGA